EPLDPGRYMVTSACKNPEIALMWGDGLMECEAGLRAYNGTLGVNWKWGDAKSVGINGRRGIWAPDVAKPATVGTAWYQMGMMYRSDDLRLGEVVPAGAPIFEKVLQDETAAKLYPYRVSQEKVLPPLYLTDKQLGVASEVATLYSGYIPQYIAKFCLGQLDPDSDSDWKSYTDTIKRMGRDRYVKVQQAAYDAQYT
ncbi:hypothetical protein, partial [Mangrovactinospora gilvigrisea]|uniref:hypothetical protein n=1 Tax=Mangrovactinospora gilvigrisea TaxID=1428644 RepID=UPI000B252C23